MPKPYPDFSPTSLSPQTNNPQLAVTQTNPRNFSSTPPHFLSFSSVTDVPVLRMSRDAPSSADSKYSTSRLTHENTTQSKFSPTVTESDKDAAEKTSPQSRLGIVVAVDESQEQLLVGWIKDIGRFFQFKRDCRRERLSSGTQCLSQCRYGLSELTLLTDAGLCVCPSWTSLEKRRECPAYLRNTTYFPDSKIFHQWQENLYASNLCT